MALLAFPLVTAGCGSRQVWGVPTEQLRDDLARAHYDSLSSIDFATRGPDEILALAPEAPYYLSFVFDSLDMQAQSLAMLELAWSRSPSPWKEEAGVLLAQRYTFSKSWDKAAAVARRLVASPGSPGVEQRARRALSEALYWNRDDAAALEESAGLSNPDPEVLLFRAVSSLRLGLAPAHDLVMQLFLDERTSALHGRFAAFLAGEPGFLPLFSAAEQRVIAGKNALVQGAWATALSELEGALGVPDPAPLAHSALLQEMGGAYVYAGRYPAGEAFMQRIAEKLTGQPRVDALEQAGKLARRARDYPRALSLLRAAAESASAPDQRDRVRWFVLDILFALSPTDLAARVAAEAGHWSDSSYFSDLLEDRISEMVIARRWVGLEDLRVALAAGGPDSIQAELDYILARAWQEGKIRRLKGSTAGELFADAARRDPSGYYGILSASMLGQVPARAVTASVPADSERAAVLDPLTMGFLSYGLSGEAYGRLWATRQELTNAQLVEAARRFASAGDLRSSMYFIGALARRRRLTEAELDLYYPRGYAALVEPLAASAGIPLHVLYGLVREESYFDADVVSSAGAVGLSQLMPATAGGVARSLRIAEPDLRDPTTNLTLGVRHLQDLMRSVDNPTRALLAYNAGLSRLRQWERAAGGLPADLFVESVPIAETRGYVRKILVSAVMYAFLYRDADPRETALSFFGIRQGPLGQEQDGAPRGAVPSR